VSRPEGPPAGSGREPGLPPPHPPERNTPELAAPSFRCDLCGAPMLDRHCKLLCLSCGYQRDCSDP
jgi:hypothetical protein